jgi:dihydroorotate dehydrogenase (fumarate)
MGMELGPNQYLKLLESAKNKVNVPVIASLNCVSEQWWSEYAKKLENHGADAIELNISYLPINPQMAGKEVEQLYTQVVKKIVSLVSIPVAVKVGPYFSNLAALAKGLHRAGAKALVLFNRFYQVDFDIDKMTVKPGKRFSDPAEISLPLRWISLLSDEDGIQLASTTGVHDADGLIKMLLAGAQVVEVSSAFYQKGTAYAGELVQGLNTWMDHKGFASIDAFRGKLSRSQQENPEMLERLQYIKALVGIE